MDTAQKFLAKIYTKPQASASLRMISDFLNFKFFDLGNDQLSFNQTLAQFELKSIERLSHKYLESKIKLIKQFPEQFFALFNRTNFQKELKKITQAVAKAEVVTIHLPFQLPEEEQTKLGSWFKDNLGLTTLYEVSFDPSLIGGCALSFKGFYKDLSLKARIAANQQQIVKSLRQFKQWIRLRSVLPAPSTTTLSG